MRWYWEDKGAVAMIDRINIDGPLRIGDGYSQMTRGLIRAFTRLGVEVHSEMNWTEPQDPEPEILAALARGFDHHAPSVRMSQPDSFDAAVGFPKVGFSMWEFDRLPRARWRDNHDGSLRRVQPWAEGADSADIILTPCENSRRLFELDGVTKPLHVVPLGYDPDYYTSRSAPAFPWEEWLTKVDLEKDPKAELLALMARLDGFLKMSRILREPRPFTFVLAGTLSSRKNPNLVYQAFEELFGGVTEARLVLKSCAHLSLRHEPKSNIEIINADWSHLQLADLYNAADVFVNPSQGEGFGLTNIEAMACGLPVIVTRWSAPVDYVDPDCGWLLDWDWEELGSDFCLSDDPDGHAPGFPACYEWQTFHYAQPTLESLKAAMWEAFTRRKETREKGRAAALKAQGYTWEHTARRISDILEGYRG